jgi:hypothetical protein
MQLGGLPWWEMLPLAHAGHYWTWALYLPPVLIVIASIARNAIAERRKKR